MAIINRAAIVGAGVIGRSWALVFARSGVDVRLFDLVGHASERAKLWIAQADPVASAHVHIAASLGEAVTGVDWVQESGPDDITIRQRLFAELDGSCASHAIIASSCSSFDPTDFSGGLEIADRSLVVHPLNPPHLIPAVEVLGSQSVPEATLHRAVNILKDLGQSPVLMKKFVPGLLSSRLQMALMREAFNLLTSGVTDAAGIDTFISDGLGPRWAVLGTFGTNHGNADGGIREYFTKYGDDYTKEMELLSSQSPIFDDVLIEQLAEAMSLKYKGHGTDKVISWRDTLVEDIMKLKRRHPFMGHSEARTA